MRRISKSRKGFSLVEMVIVIAIIVILASVVLFNAKDILDMLNELSV